MSSARENTSASMDALLPPQMAAKAEAIGEAKASLDTISTFVLAVLAGAFIAWGGVFYTTVVTTGEHGMPYGVTKLLGGLSFSLGLILVIVAGAELFTGNSLIVMAWASGRISIRQLLRNWVIVYGGNFLGAVGTAVLVHLAGLAEASGGAVGDTMLKIAAAKCSLTWLPGIAAGAGCNVLVCLAVWLCLSCRTVTDKVLAIVFPISAFVATGMEHSVANMYFIPAAMLTSLARGGMDPAVTLSGFANNLIPVTIGNVVGGSVFVGLVYWFIYLRPTRNEHFHDDA